MKFYAGIGSRSITDGMNQLMREFAIKIAEEDYILRSGGASGADQAFEAGAEQKEIFRAEDAEEWAYEEVKTCLPTDRSGFDNWKPYVKATLARNMMQVLGCNGDQPVDFVLCYAPSFDYTDSSAGGTGYAIRCAIKYNIPVINLYDSKNVEYIKEYLGSTEEFQYKELVKDKKDIK